MARPQNTVRGRARLARDSQQWMLDYLIQETGKVLHFQGDRHRAHWRLRHQPRVVLGPAFRSPGPAHSCHRSARLDLL
jgi:hypothetical protein